MTTNRADPAFDRAIEYIDSPLMTQRLVYRKQLSARIEGNYGTYRTTVRVGRTFAGCAFSKFCHSFSLNSGTLEGG